VLTYGKVTRRHAGYSTRKERLGDPARRRPHRPSQKKIDICQISLADLRNFSHNAPLRLILLKFSRNVGGKSKSFPTGDADMGVADPGAVLFFPWILFLAKEE
jgi:hypothetical protein